jgi:hypothetical protein
MSFDRVDEIGARRVVMKTFVSFVVMVGLSISLALTAENGGDVRGDYFGQKPPGMTPEIFAPGIVSTEKKELNSVFTPDG